MKIGIGKANDNQVIIDESSVSRHHAQLIRDEQGNLLIEDLNSTNGTLVNDCRILRKKVKLDDLVTFGADYTLTVSEILKLDNDYSEEFARLSNVYETFVKAKIRIQSNNQFKTRLFQSLPFAFVGVVGIVFGFTGHASKWLFIMSFVLAVCAPTIGIYFGARQAAKIPAQLQSLINQFKIDYVCPKCGTFLGELPWESLYNKKNCPVASCKAKWIRT